MAQTHAALGDPGRAAAAVAEGRGHYPADAELLCPAANLERERGRPREAEALYRELAGGRTRPTSRAWTRGSGAVLGRNNLAVLLLEQKRPAEAEGVCPPARFGLPWRGLDHVRQTAEGDLSNLKFDGGGM